MFYQYLLHYCVFSQNTEYYYNLGNSKMDTEDYYGAISDFTRAIEINPNYGEAYSYRGVSKAKLGDYNGACKDANKSQKLGVDAYILINLVCN
ncbi:MAG: tetratricopeptide repeat protein [Flavobacteriaceae bacterium]|nr:tetratricopeptide repeat protein [Flavobacteriaceae bacterium]